MRLIDLLFGWRLAFFLIECGMCYALLPTAYRFMFSGKWFDGKNNERFVTGIWMFAFGALSMNIVSMGSAITESNWVMIYTLAVATSMGGITLMATGFFLSYIAWYGAVSDLSPKIVVAIWGPIILMTIVLGSLLSWATRAFTVFA